MAREKVTITLDRPKAEAAAELLQASSISEAVDMALDRVVKAERLRRDIAIYRETGGVDEVPPVEVENRDLDDDTDWEAVYAE